MRRRRSHPRTVAAAQTAAPNNSSSALLWISDSRYSWLSATMLFLLILYMCVPENVFEARPPLTALDAVTAAPDPFYRFLKLALLTSACGVIVWRFALVVQVIRRLNIFLLVFVALVALSITWSITPASTVARLAAVFNIVLVSCSFVLIGWHVKRFQSVIRPTLTLFLFARCYFA
jgi:hypothetical protein